VVLGEEDIGTSVLRQLRVPRHLSSLVRARRGRPGICSRSPVRQPSTFATSAPFLGLAGSRSMGLLAPHSDVIATTLPTSAALASGESCATSMSWAHSLPL